jgi:hypothetical protein
MLSIQELQTYIYLNARIRDVICTVCIVLQMEEEIEIKQLRKGTVPKAHPMPDFTKPFVPKRYQNSVFFVYLR